MKGFNELSDTNVDMRDAFFEPLVENALNDSRIIILRLTTLRLV